MRSPISLLIVAILVMTLAASGRAQDPVAVDGKAGFDHPGQYLHLQSTLIADNMEPVIPHPKQDMRVRQKLADLETNWTKPRRKRSGNLMRGVVPCWTS